MTPEQQQARDVAHRLNATIADAKTDGFSDGAINAALVAILARRTDTERVVFNER